MTSKDVHGWPTSDNHPTKLPYLML